MKLDPEVARLLSAMPAIDPAAPRPTAQQARAMHHQIGAMMAGFLRPIAVVRDFDIAGPAGAIKARLYRPVEQGELPLLLFLHGGGWIGGDLETHEMLCRDVALDAGCAVVAIDYRVAPEHKFPAALEDSLAAARYVLDHAAALGADPARIAIGGDSAGGNLSAAVVQALKDRAGARPMFQLLLYPATDLRGLTPAHAEMAEAPGLSARDARWCMEQYLETEAQKLDPRASPVLAADLAGTPPTMVLTAEVDPLRDDGEAYAARLVTVGTEVRVRRYLGLPHGFLSLPPMIARRQQALAEVCRALRQVFAVGAA